MTIQEFAAMLDDYTGELSQAVQKLEIERSRGTLNPDEQMDLVEDLRQAVRAQRIWPWRRKALFTIVPGVVLVFLSFLPAAQRLGSTLRLGICGLGGILILGGLYCLWRMQAFRTLECRWLKGLEEHLRKGGTVFDAPER